MIKINKITPLAIYFMMAVALVMHLVMYTAKDRANYLKHFADPFNNRLEPLFQWYMWLLTHILSPQVAIVMTGVIIYTLFYNVWFKLKSRSFLIYFLFFNFVMFGVFNYYLGTSIRMGLAIAIGIYSASLILQGVKVAWIALISSFLVHYGLVLFVLFFFWYSITKNKPKKFHFLITFGITIFCILGFDLLLGFLGLGSYYMMYFTDGFGQTDRIIPFTILYFLFSVFFIFSFLNDRLVQTIPRFRFLYLSTLYCLPLVIYQLVSGVAIFSKMLMPQFLFMSIMLAHVFIKRFYLISYRYIYISLFLILNLASFFYALRMYQYI